MRRDREAGFAMMTVVMGVGAALVALGVVFSTLATAIGGIITVVTAAIAVFKVIAAVIAFLVSPVGLVIAAIVALGAYILYATGAAGETRRGRRHTILPPHRPAYSARAAR